MGRVKAPSESTPRRPMRPALTPEARENQLISLAIDLVEQRLLDGTASSQETTHFLKLATSKAKLERERFELENELIKAKTKVRLLPALNIPWDELKSAVEVIKAACAN